MAGTAANDKSNELTSAESARKRTNEDMDSPFMDTPSGAPRQFIA